VICYETWLNGRRLCTAGMPGYGVLSMGLCWVKRDPAKRPKGWAKKTYEAESHVLDVGGLFREEHLGWVRDRKVRPGDVVRIRIVRRTAADSPDPKFTSPAPPPTRLERLRSDEKRLLRMLKEVRDRIRKGMTAQRRAAKR
jgi:hypothetical protein